MVKEDFEKVVSYIDGTSTLPVCVFQLVPKTPEEAVRLRKILSRNYLFSELATGQLDNVVEVCLSFEFVKLATSLISQVMKPLKFSANQDVIRQEGGIQALIRVMHAGRYIIIGVSFRD